MDSPLLDSLSEDDRSELVRNARRRRFGRGDVIFLEGDPGDAMYVIARGHVEVRITTPLGDVATLRILSPGEYFGELALISAAPRSATVIALDDVETLGITTQVFEDLQARRRVVGRLVTDALAQEIRRLDTALAEALYLPSEQRLLRRLVELTDTFGTSSGGACVVPLTQEQLAQLGGVARPTANRILKKAEDDGLLLVRRGRVEVLDVDRLSRAAG
jgi:CRP-like cAMP-binding protein